MVNGINKYACLRTSKGDRDGGRKEGKRELGWAHPIFCWRRDPFLVSWAVI
jgi:hypothetical protein